MHVGSGGGVVGAVAGTGPNGLNAMRDPGSPTVLPRRVRIHRPGSYERLRIEAMPLEPPGPGEVRVRAHAIGVNYADCIVRMGLYRSAREYVGWPITPGFEVAGTVDEVGEDVSLERGARVMAVTRFGGYASHVVVPAHQVFALPDALSFEEGAAFPAVFLTAWYALFELAHPRPGQHLLVHSAAGGVGSALVQLGKLARCRVTGVVGAPHKVEAARALGADDVVDKSREPLWPTLERIAPGGFDVILDANGVETLRESYAHLARPGKLVIYGFASMLPRDGRVRWGRLALDWLRTPRFDPLALTSACKSVLAFNLSYLFDRRELLALGMRDLLAWLGEGRIRLPSIATYPLDEVARAHRELESGRTVGKLVLTLE